MRRTQTQESNSRKHYHERGRSGPLGQVLPSFVVVFALFVLPCAVFAAGLVNINTADKAELMTLNGIGEVKSQAIIDYRTQNGPFQKIEDIMNVSGIGPVTFDNIKSSITVDVENTTQTPTAGQTQDTAALPQTSAQTTTGSEPVPPLTAEIIAPASNLAGAGGYFSGRAFGTVGEPVANARYIWNFGDGTTVEGQKVLHTYTYPGTYILILTVASGYSTGRATRTIVVSPAQVELVTENDYSLLVQNNSTQTLDIGFWQLVCPTSSFLIPEQTTIVAGGGVRFAPGVTGVACGTQAELMYPSGTVAATAQASADSPLRGQPVAPSERIKTSLASAGAVTVARAVAPSPQKTGEVPQKSLLAAVGAALPAGAEWFVALMALVLLGAAGVFIAQNQKVTAVKNETKAPTDEFEIVDN